MQSAYMYKDIGLKSKPGQQMTIMQNIQQGTEYTENQHNTPTVWTTHC